MTPSPYFLTYLRHLGFFRLLNWLYETRIETANQWREAIFAGSFWLVATFDAHGMQDTRLDGRTALVDVKKLYSNEFNYLSVH